MSEKLNPCPFCGGDSARYVPDEATAGVDVSCPDCGAIVSQNNIGDWNRRAAPAVSAEPVAWRYKMSCSACPDGVWVDELDTSMTLLETQALYLHPPAADPVADKMAEAFAELRRAAEFLDLCRDDLGSSVPTGALRDGVEWFENAARAALAEWEEQKGGA